MPSSTFLARALALVALVQFAMLPVQAHIELKSPPGINSKYDPQTAEGDKDYSMTSPLAADGSNYPCKDYNTASAYSKLNSVSTLTAGSTLNVELDGSATHNGGSCQFSISYDQGETWAVIHSVIGGCPIGLNFAVPIPSNLPSASKATLSWSWFNLSGNREMYHNCAIVDVAGSDATSYTGPAPFRANTFADGTCITTEGQEIVFPNAGDSVAYLGASTSSSAQTILDNCSYDEDADVTISPSGSIDGGSGGGAGSGYSSPPGATSAPSPTSRTQTRTSTRSKASLTQIATSMFSPVVKAVSTTAPAASFNAVTSSIRSEAPSATTTVATSSAPASSPASSTNSQSGSTSGSTTLHCDSTTTFSLCGGGTCTPMGNVAAGTVCADGAIIAETRKRTHSRRSRKH